MDGVNSSREHGAVVQGQKTLSLVDAARVKIQASRSAMEKELKLILARGESPQPADADRVLEILQALGIPLHMLEEMAKLVQQESSCDATIAANSSVSDEVFKAQHELWAVDDWYRAETDRITQEADARRQKLNPVLARARGGRELLSRPIRPSLGRIGGGMRS